jgi:hypothetical protein
MNWKFLLFVTAAVVSGKKPTYCPAIDVPGCLNGANTNFNFYGDVGYWIWVSGTIPGSSIDDTGLITFNTEGAEFPVTFICIQWKDGTYTYVVKPGGQTCYLQDFTRSISNLWGY